MFWIYNTDTDKWSKSRELPKGFERLLHWMTEGFDFVFVNGNMMTNEEKEVG